MLTSDHAAQRDQPQGSPDPEAAVCAERLAASERAEHRSLLRGLLLLALIVLAFSIIRAGFPRVFVPGWWKQW